MTIEGIKMKNISVSSDIIPVGEFKASLAKYLKEINLNRNSLIITQNGKPAGVLISPSEFDELYIDRDQFIHLLAIWKTCHLNDMNAGSLLQMEYVNFWRDQVKSFNGWDYDQARAMLKQHHLLIYKLYKIIFLKIILKEKKTNTLLI